MYPVGMIAVNAVLLFRARDAILHGRTTPLSRAIAFLYREYEPHMFWCAPSAATQAHALHALRRYLPAILSLNCNHGRLLRTPAGGRSSRWCVNLCLLG